VSNCCLTPNEHYLKLHFDEMMMMSALF